MQNIKEENNFDIPYSTLSSPPPLSCPPVGLAKFWSLATSLDKILFRKF